MYKPVAISFLISTLLAAPAFAGAITDLGAASPPGLPVNTAGAGLENPLMAKLAPADLRAALLGCHAPGCAGGVSQYLNLANSYKFATGTFMPDGTPDTLVLSGDKPARTSMPEPATYALLGFGALGMLALRRSRPSVTI